MQISVRDAIEAATAARRFADEKLDVARCAARLSANDRELIFALCAVLGAQASLSEALMQLCCTLTDRHNEPAPARPAATVARGSLN
jgi:hypothetical protein